MSDPSGELLRNATLETLDLEIALAWTKLLKAKPHDIDKQMACVDALLDKRLVLTESRPSGR